MRRKSKLSSMRRIYRRRPVQKLLLLALFQSLVFNAGAQTETVTDTTIMLSDTLYDSEYEEEESAGSGDLTNYFLPKSAGGGLDSIQLRQLPDTVLNRMAEDPDFWYANKQFLLEKQRRKTSLSDQSWFQSLLWIFIIGGFAVFMILYLANSNVRLFRRPDTSLDTEAADPDSGDIFSINFSREIDRAAGTGNYRLAIRLMFLQLLKNLSEKNIIQYTHNRTNFDYLSQLYATRYYEDFFRITRHYEYSWYGQFEVSPQAFAVIKKEFDDFKPSIQ